ncbi:unnamed protein product, partial [marine sediment metagenome]
MIFILPTIAAINLQIEKQSSNEVMILDLNNPAIFNLNVTNHGPSDDFLFYTFFGITTQPTGTVHINQGETKDVQIQILPSYNLKTGFSTFNLFIQAGDRSETEKQLTVRIVDLKDAFEVGSGEINPETSSLQVYIHNKVNFDFGEINVTFSSVFFDFGESFSLGQNERKNFDVQLNKEDFKKLMAGFYTLKG